MQSVPIPLIWNETEFYLFVKQAGITPNLLPDPIWKDIWKCTITRLKSIEIGPITTLRGLRKGAWKYK